MNIIRLLLLLCVVAGTVLGQKPGPYAIPPGARLELGSDILRQTYCECENVRLERGSHETYAIDRLLLWESVNLIITKTR